MTDYRMLLVDAAVAELKSQLGEECVMQDGTRVHIDGTVKMARVVEAVINVALGRPANEMREKVVEYLTMDREEIIHPEDIASDLLLDVQAIIARKLDPLP